MSEPSASYRQILRSTAIIGGASLVNIVMGLVRTKIVAVLLGPVGIGIVTIYTSLISTASTVAAMGIGIAGPKQIAGANVDEDKTALVSARRAIFVGTVFLALIGASSVWILRELLALYILGDAQQSEIVGWLSLGVALSVFSIAQGALLQGLRRIGDMARLSVISAFINTVLGSILLWSYGVPGLVAYAVLGPLINFLCGVYFLARLPVQSLPTPTAAELVEQWVTMLRIGIPFMAAGFVGSVVQLWIRVEIGSSLGIDAVGQFQAAWMLSMHYIGFVLSAMGADYYPRLSSIFHDREASIQLVNQQTKVALLLAGPILMSMITFAPWIIALLYSSDFADAVIVLRWQVMGDLFKILCWPLGFIILASGKGKTFFCVESMTYLIMASIIFLFVSTSGLEITGIAFFISYVALLIALYFITLKSIRFYWEREIQATFVLMLLLCLIIFFVTENYFWGTGIASMITVAFTIYSFVKVSQLRSTTPHAPNVG